MHAHSQRIPIKGAALPITLIMLVVIVVLAVAAMRSTSFGFLMATNEQLRERAFIASETGIEQAISTILFDPTVTNNLVVGPTATAANGDAYNTQIVTQMNGAPQGAIFGSSWNQFSTYQFQIISAGSSARGATAVHTQGVAVIAPNQSSFSGGTGTCL